MANLIEPIHFTTLDEVKALEPIFNGQSTKFVVIDDIGYPIIGFLNGKPVVGDLEPGPDGGDCWYLVVHPEFMYWHTSDMGIEYHMVRNLYSSAHT